jgi:hypothetical protein
MSENNGHEVITFLCPTDLVFKVGLAAALKKQNRSEFIRDLLVEATDDIIIPERKDPEREPA